MVNHTFTLAEMELQLITSTEKGCKFEDKLQVQKGASS